MLSSAPVVPTLPVVDLERAKKFYQEKLGLKPLPVSERDAAMFECGAGTQLFIYKRAPTKADNTAAAFLVSDIEGTIRELKNKGIKFEEYDFPGLKTINSIATMGSSKGAWFKDTEGNILGLAQYEK